MAKTPVKVEYTKYPGIVTRIIEKSDWERMGETFDTIEFSVAQGYIKDATDWPEGVIEYFRGDEEFTVTSGERAAKSLGIQENSTATPTPATSPQVPA